MTTTRHKFAIPTLSSLFCYLVLASAHAVPPTGPAAKPGVNPSSAAREPQPEDVMAVVNREPITRKDLAQECLRHYGEDVLENLISMHLLADACRNKSITISDKEIDAEIEKLATRFEIPVEQWYKMIFDERGIRPEAYRDMIWIILAQKKLAGSEMQITQEELRKEFETQYGPAVKARLIAVESPDVAKTLRAKAVANPASFGDLAKQHSVDTVSASTKGWIAPIHLHSTTKSIEDAAFSLQDGQISQVIPFPDAKQYIIIKREGLIPAQETTLEKEAPALREYIEQKKLNKVGHSIVKDLQEKAKVENYFKDPKTQNSNVAAVLNGKKISVNDLANECIRRHGVEALEGVIARRLLEQACKKNGISISEQDLNDEIIRAAHLSLPPKKDGSPNVEQWMKLATEDQGVSQEVYIRDSVWPSVALKKLVGDSVQISEMDIQKGIEANYGPRANCLAIVLNDLRRATYVWGLAQKDPTPTNFGALAEQYSVDPASRKLRGEIPPIRKHTGIPELEKVEKEAFSLKRGELSSILNVDGKYVILLSLGQTAPMKVDTNEVRKLIYEDLREKKLRIEMSKYFETLKNSATIDNHLTGTTQSPRQGPSVEVPPSSLRPVKID